MGYLTDLLLLLFLLLQTYTGWRSGLLWQATGLAAAVLGVGLGALWAPVLGVRLKGTFTQELFCAQLVAFLLVAGLAALALRLVATWAEVRAEQGLPKPEREERRSHDRVLGGIFGALKGSLLAMVLVAAGVSLWPAHVAWEGSRLSPALAQAGSRVLPEGAVGRVRGWVAHSVLRLREGLQLQTSGPEDPRPQPLLTAQPGADQPTP